MATRDRASPSRSTSLHTEPAGGAHPETFGPFRVLHQVGAGALGPVFRAYDPGQDKLVAVKLLRLDLAPERVHRLVAQLEALVDADLTHPSIAAPLAAGISDVAAYLALDFVAADSADLVIREHGPAPPAEAIRVASHVASALGFALDANIAHGALHPRDILVSPDDVRITGLGIVQALERIGFMPPVRRPYTAPERAAGGAWDGRADVFSLAAIVHELLWGRRVAATGQQVARGLTPIEGADLDALGRLFAQALAEDPTDRPDSPMAFIESLRSALTVGSRQSAVGSRQSAVASQQSAVDGRQSAVDGRQSAVGSEQVADAGPSFPPPLAPGSAPATGHAEARQPEGSSSGERAVDLLAARATVRPPSAEEPRLPLDDQAAPLDTFEPLDRAAPATAEEAVFTASAALDRARSAVWPLGLALAVGLSVGFATGYAVASRDRGDPRQVPAASAAPVPAATVGVLETEVPLKTDATQEAQPSSSDARLKPDSTPSVSTSAALPPSATSAAVERASAAPPPGAVEGRLLIRSSPSGATVLVDGRDVGRTPVTVDGIEPGSHTVRVARDGFVAAQRRVALSASRRSESLTFELRPVQAASRTSPTPTTPATIGRATSDVTIESRPPGARIWLDGKLVGTTPMTVGEIAPGLHSVSLELAGYRRWTTSVRVVAGERQRVGASLER